MDRKKQAPNPHSMQDVPVPPIRAGENGSADVLLHPGLTTGRPINLDDTIIFDGLQ